MRGGPAGTAVRARAARGRGKLFEQRADRAIQDWLPPRLLAGHIVKVDTLYQENRISAFDHARLRAHAWRVSDLLECRPEVKRAVSEIRWFETQGEAMAATHFREAARLFSTG